MGIILKAWCLIFLIIQTFVYIIHSIMHTNDESIGTLIGGFLGCLIGGFSYFLIIKLFITNVF